MRILLSLVAVLALSCGADSPTIGLDASTGPAPDADPGALGQITGRVWAPGNAPGMVPSGHEIPVLGALVYLSQGPPSPIPQNTYCESCELPAANFAVSDHEGYFTITNILPGTYWMMIQKGQFRLDQQVVVGPGLTVTLTDLQATLPSEQDPINGKWIPKIALASGSYDSLEDIMGKVGLGEVDQYGKFVGNAAAGAFDVYANGGDIDNIAIGTLADLVGNLNTMLNYHIIFIPCSSDSNASALQDPDNLRNIRDFVSAGGKLYVTDWSGEWADNVFPAQMDLGDVDTPADAYNPVDDTWTVASFGNADGFPSYTAPDAEAVDPDLNQWLNGQSGPLASGGEGTFNSSSYAVTGNWVHIEGLTTVDLGVDNMGNPVSDEPRTYVIGSDGDGVGKKPLTVTFEPVGCGRVLYSTYHTTDDTHLGLVPQERVLVYLMLEIGECKDGPIVE